MLAHLIQIILHPRLIGMQVRCIASCDNPEQRIQSSVPLIAMLTQGWLQERAGRLSS